mmetsp:Transcript_4930/g.17650  ORF Transcript_4930/g.17650 Transcript_4930/m.17650 type:complete len:271 (+) Transcript_4930:4320-5132(+)
MQRGSLAGLEADQVGLTAQMRIGLALAGAHQQRPATARGEAGQGCGHAVEVLRVGDGDDPHAPAGGEGVQQLGQAVAAVAQAQAWAQGHQRVQAGVERLQRQHGQPVGAQALFGLGQRVARGQAERGQQLERAHAAVEVMPAEDQHRHARTGQQAGDQRHQIGLLARAVEAGQQHGARAFGRGHGRGAGLHGGQEAGDLVGALALHAQRDQQRAQLQIGHHAIEHRAKEVLGLGARQVAGAAGASAHFLDQSGVVHRASVETTRAARGGP